MNMSDSHAHQKIQFSDEREPPSHIEPRTFRAKNEVQLSTFDNNSGIFGTAREPMRSQAGQ